MKKAGIFLCLALLGAAVFPASRSDDFSRGIAYYLVGDLELARKNMDAYFDAHPQPTIKLGFVLLLQNDKWEATKKFRDYLESDHRSLEALTGISLATADVKNSLAIDNLNKILRMNPGYAPAYLCLGNEYLLRDNFPAA
jgi:tetratricopeptide (TPR) repeat protein